MQENKNTLIEEKINEKKEVIHNLILEIHKKVIGQDKLIKNLLVWILSRWHILLEWVPWVAKTLTASTLSSSMNLDFKRVQFTPDLLPSDLIWTEIYNMWKWDFETKKWPIFTNLLLADEINRAPSKVQSALLEAMAEKQVTIWDETFVLDKPFIVLATQNPIEQAWTYSLPEAELDRFMLKVYVDYPSRADEKKVAKNILQIEETKTKKVISKKELLWLQDLVKEVYVSDNIIDYVSDIIHATRLPEEYWLENLSKYLKYWVSPRWTISLIFWAKAIAFLAWRAFVIPEDIKEIAVETLAHRLVLTYEAIADEITWNQIIEKIIDSVSVK